MIDPSSAAGEPDLVTAAAADRCSSCDAPLASDQRYCVACGDRRGKPRFAYQERSEPTAPVAKRRDHRLRAPAGLQLIAGVATLLLAMGVGVLIGQNGNSNSAKGAATPAAQVITVNGTGGGAGTAATTASNTKGSKSTRSSKASTKVAHLSKKTTQAVNSGAASVIGSQAKLAPPTTKVGGKCTTGQAGCQNNSFTGNFFGGG